MRQVFLNTRVYAKQKISLTWPNVLEVGKRMLQAPTMEAFETIFGSFNCYLLSQGVVFYMLSSFRYQSLKFIHSNYF